ncbi:MAG: SBBP repeat-containing protein, partial [bacterium]|nr:SBBP repeat-containing protein [Candidatus Kapabacteria bacterium]
MNGIAKRIPFFTACLLFTLASTSLDAQTFGKAAKSVVFVENGGQWSGPGRYLARYGGLDLWVADNALIYDFHRSDAGGRRGHVVRMEFVGTGSSRAVSVSPSLTERHYYVGAGSNASGAKGARAFDQIGIRRVLPGVDAVTYDDGGYPRYDLHVAAGVDPRSIRLRFSGADHLSIAPGGGLLIGTSLGEIEQRELRAYQKINGFERTVGCQFVIRPGGDVGFAITGHDARYPLVIDPLTYSTLVGGVGDDISNGIAVDSSGSAYIVGETSSPDYPYVTGSYFASLQGATDAFVTKISPDGSTIVFSTFIGGTDSDVAHDVAVTPGGTVFVAGSTGSADFPARRGYDSTYNGATDAFVLRLDSLGQALVWSTLIGGSADDRANALAIDNANQVYVAGTTLSSSFPTSPGAFQTTALSGEAFALKLNSLGRSIVYSTFIGGDKIDEAVDIVVRNGNAYVAGNTDSDGATGDPFPTTTGATQGGFAGMTDGFVTVLDSTGRTAVFSTLLGGSNVDMIRGIALDSVAAVYVTGVTSSSTFPITANAMQVILSGSSDAFVTKFGPDGSALNYSTFIGGSGIDGGEDIGVTSKGFALVTGNTTSNGFPTVNGAVQQTKNGAQDMFIIELGASAQGLVYGSFLGGTANDSVISAAIVGETTLYLTGTTTSMDYPTTLDAAQRNNRGGFEAFATRFDLLQVTSQNSRVTLCAGDTHLITWSGGNSVNYDIALSANNGQSWSPIAFTVSGNSFLWAMPAQQPAGNTYRIRVTVSGSAESDANDSAFNVIARPTVNTSPSSLTRAEGSNVTFSSRGVGATPTSMFWQRSDDGGLTWTEVPGSQGMEQLVVSSINASDDSARFRAIYYNTCDSVPTQSALLIVQAVRVLTPVGGEAFCIGSTQNITFTRQHVSAVNIELSTNDGVNFSPIATNVSGDSFSWTIPASLRPGNGFRIRVVHSNGAAADVNDAAFAIHSAPNVIGSPADATGGKGS